MRHASLFNNIERTKVKASVRKQAQQLLETLPPSQTLERLQREFKEKGFLSKRELKELLSLKADASQAA